MYPFPGLWQAQVILWFGFLYGLQAFQFGVYLLWSWRSFAKKDGPPSSRLGAPAVWESALLDFEIYAGYYDWNLFMKNDHLTNSHHERQNQFFRKVIGISFLITGILAILLSLNIIEYVDLHPNRIAIFNDPHTWEVFMLGVMCVSFGIANILSPGLKLIGKINNLVLLISFIAVLLGVILNKVQ